MATTRYHVNPDTHEVGVCSAEVQCRFGADQKHYEKREEAQRDAEESLAQKYATFSPVKKSGAGQKGRLSEAALSSSLEVSEDQKPAWWSSYEDLSFYGEEGVYDIDDTSDHPAPVMLDRISLGDRDGVVTWRQKSPLRQDASHRDMGFEVSTLEIRDEGSGELVSRMTLIRVSDESYEEAFGDDEYSRVRFYSSQLSLHVDVPEKTGDEMEDLMNKQGVWMEAHAKLGAPVKLADGSMGNAQNVEFEDIPMDEETLDRDLRNIESYRVRVEDPEEYREYFGNYFVDYSFVDEDDKGKGIGSAAYIYAARCAGKSGSLLRGSGLQSGDAQGVWSRFSSGALASRVKDIDLKRADGLISTYPVLDFTDEEEW